MAARLRPYIHRGSRNLHSTKPGKLLPVCLAVVAAVLLAARGAHAQASGDLRIVSCTSTNGCCRLEFHPSTSMQLWPAIDSVTTYRLRSRGLNLPTPTQVRRFVIMSYVHKQHRTSSKTTPTSISTSPQLYLLHHNFTPLRATPMSVTPTHLTPIHV